MAVGYQGKFNHLKVEGEQHENNMERVIVTCGNWIAKECIVEDINSVNCKVCLRINSERYEYATTKRRRYTTGIIPPNCDRRDDQLD